MAALSANLLAGAPFPNFDSVPNVSATAGATPSWFLPKSKANAWAMDEEFPLLERLMNSSISSLDVCPARELRAKTSQGDADKCPFLNAVRQMNEPKSGTDGKRCPFMAAVSDLQQEVDATLLVAPVSSTFQDSGLTAVNTPSVFKVAGGLPKQEGAARFLAELRRIVVQASPFRNKCSRCW
eukprot:CAMPEP_0196662608 /NCGR_PEP_ID=MMETSP1086-20130531/49523_1 /TAXON_ID=77921 /ORGANISM="Cyanoptyche  gloeocystis , Strain SAG4.97" /LENGTH=181 /DNA_ID=CAMNT_0041998089 /DNA_START=26 /DNA_END=568 /DNA_ORIENTATION=+